MLPRLQYPLKYIFLRLEAWGDAIFGSHYNPFYYLGALAWFNFWIVAGTGIYLYVFLDTSVTHAYSSVEYITHEQWYLAGITRSLHRYSSDAMVVLALVHLLREWAMDRYHGPRWFAWFTGIPTLWLLFFCGVSGYWLVWDMLAQYLAIDAMEWLDWVGIFSEPIANNFLTEGSLSDRFFSLLIYIHIFVPLALLFLMWIHLLRIARAETNPPRYLAIGTFAALLVLSLVQPAVSHGPADLTKVPSELHLDWFFLGLFPLFDKWGPAALWALTVGGSMLLAVMPFVRRAPKKPAAVVDLANCNGCTRCFADCPFGAVTMVPRTDGLPFEKEAVVNPDLCTGCGICMGACPTTTPFRTKGELSCGIQLPDLDLPTLRNVLDDAVRPLSGKTKVVVFGCEHGAHLPGLRSAEVGVVVLPCTGHLAPSFVDYAFSRAGIDGVVITGCRDGECFHRLGVRWTEERIAGKRDPALRARVPRERIRIAWAGPLDLPKLTHTVKTFTEELSRPDAETNREADRAASVAMTGGAE